MLIVEDGTIVDGANSYISVVDADDYVSNYMTSSRQQTWNDLTTEDKEVQLINATEFVDLFVNWVSEIRERGQSLNWPRYEFLDSENRVVEEDTIPEAIVNAVVEIAVEDLENDIYEESVKLKSESFGDSSETYAGYSEQGGNKLVKRLRTKLSRLGYATKRTTFIELQRS